MELETIVEAVLFTSSRPLPFKTLVKKLDKFSAEEVFSALIALSRRLKDTGRAMEVVEVSGGYQLRTRPEFREWVKPFARERDGGLTRPMLETLAVVAYKQPVTKRDIDTMRGVDSAKAIKHLLENKFIEIAGREEEIGHKMVFRTTKRFLELYGLKDMGDLPTYRELESIEES